MNFDNLEEFLQSEVNNQKMFPSDRVWSNIAKEIQPTKSWPALTVISLFIVFSLGIATSIYYPPKTNLLSNIYVSSEHANNSSNSLNNKNKNFGNSPIQNIIVAGVIPSNNNINSSYLKVIHNVPVSPIITRPKLPNPLSSNSAHAFELTKQASLISVVDVNNKIEEGNVQSSQLKAIPSVRVVLPKIVKQGFYTVVSHSSNQLKTFNNIKQPKSIQYEIYTTPSSSYRSLQNDQVLNQIEASNASNVNSKVKQKAGLGFELGLGLRYKLANNLTFKTGFQFNIRQYSIDAYQSSNGLATIQVVQNNKIETLGINSSFSNNSTGAVETRLNNKLYQISIPIGVDWTVYSKKKIGINIGASLQPTYSLNKNAYIISTDYKYYANGESLFRKWNINSCVNAGITYQTKNTTFSFGPQIRYQHLSTFVDKYPIKEYRLDYGLRLGMIKTLK